MADALDKALALLPAPYLEESVEELLARAHEELDTAVVESRRRAHPEHQLLMMAALLTAAIPSLYAEAGQSVPLEEATEEVRGAVAIQGNQPDHVVPGRLLYIHLHKALVELHRRNGRFTRLSDNGSAIEVVKGAAWLAGEIVRALETGRVELLLPPV
jgi:hypothetical protein